MFLFLFAFFASSVLKETDNPYKILGVPKNASQAEIKAAFRKLTYSLHPDVTKTRDTEKEWIKVNEAFEILSDPDAKFAYDNHGKVEKDQKLNDLTQDPMSYKNFVSEDMDVDKRSLKEVTAINFEEFTSRDGEYLFLVYTSIMCPVCNVIMGWFESFKNEQTKYVRCGIIDTSISSDLAKSLGCVMMPSLVYLKITHGEKRISVSQKPITSYRSIVDFYVSNFRVQIHQIISDSTIEELSARYRGATIVVQCVRNGPTAHFYRLASQYSAKYGAVFAFLQFPDYESALRAGIKKLPQVLIYRSLALPQITVDKMSKLDSVLSATAQPLYWPYSGKAVKTFCPSGCVIRFGYPQIEDTEIVNLNISLGVIPAENSWSGKFNMPQGAMLYVDREQNVIIPLEMSAERDSQRLLDFFNEGVDRQAFQIPPGFIPENTFVGDAIDTAMNLFERIPSAVKQLAIGALLIFAKRLLCGGDEPENNEEEGEEQNGEKHEDGQVDEKKLEQELKKMRREFLAKDARKDAEEAKKRSKQKK